MRPLSRTDWWLCAVLAALLLAGGVLWTEVRHRRQYAAEDGRFSRAYHSTMKELRSVTASVNERFSGNGGIFIEAKNIPASGAKEPEKPAPAILQGISWQADIPVALINGKVYQTGDQIGDCTLEEIKINTIRLRDADGKVTEMKLMEDIAP
jgi:hypothetical protein